MTYAHVQTYRLGTSDEVEADIAYASLSDRVVSDQTARTIASFWHSPRQNAIVRLSHGMPFDTDDLRAEIAREITDGRDAEVMESWLDMLEAILADESE